MALQPAGLIKVGATLALAGAKHGEGKYTNKQSGCRYIGVWREGALSQATVKTPDGRTMLSGFEAGEPEGAGAFVMPSGVVARGAHSHAPKADDEDADEEEPKTVRRARGAPAGFLPFLRQVATCERLSSGGRALQAAKGG
eukprot:6211065-Pleurochrysis_carterae.AAC.3